MIVIVRTLNEAKNIERFCRGYDFADRILIADGGSTDATLELANQFGNVEIREFEERVEMPYGFMNPESRHFNFVLNWAKEYEPEWVIYDDCDSIPNKFLYRDAIELLAMAQHPVLHVRRLYLWLKDQYFPKMGRGASLWAWQPDKINIYGEDKKDYGVQIRGIPDETGRDELDFPYCLLHDFYPDDETVQYKMERYAAWGMPQEHPLEWRYAPPEPLPEWAL